MKDHLPECEYEEGHNYTKGVCICPELRACEQRCDAKRHAEVKAWADLSRDNFDAGYAAGLAAARDAVAALRGGWVDLPTLVDALAAIDGLKETP